MVVTGSRQTRRRIVQTGNHMDIFFERRKRLKAGCQSVVGPCLFRNPILFRNAIAVKPEEKPSETASGIILADKTQDKPVIGLVVVGNEDVKAGDRVLFSKFGYDEVTIENELYYVVSDFNLLGIL